MVNVSGARKQAVQKKEFTMRGGDWGKNIWTNSGWHGHKTCPWKKKKSNPKKLEGIYFPCGKNMEKRKGAQIWGKNLENGKL